MLVILFILSLWWGGLASADPPTVTGLSAVSVNTTRIDLTWSDSEVDATYIIERSTVSANTGFTVIATTAPGVKTFSNTGLTPGVNYYYRVRSTDTSAAASAETSGFTCLTENTGPLVTVSGTKTAEYAFTPAANSRYDARVGTFLGSNTNLFPVNGHGHNTNGCWVGGYIYGNLSCTATWAQIYATGNRAGVLWESPNFVVDGVRLDNWWDGFRPRFDGGGFVIRNVWVSHNRDDCVENDELNAGTVDDSLFDGCYVAFSARPSANIEQDGSQNIWTISNSLVRLQPFPGPDGGGTAPNHGGFFKYHDWGSNTSRSPKLALHNNIFRVDKVGTGGIEKMGIPPGKIESCSNNIMVWRGGGAFPTSLPGCFTVTSDINVWNSAVTAWKNRHPQVANPTHRCTGFTP